MFKGTVRGAVWVGLLAAILVCGSGCPKDRGSYTNVGVTVGIIPGFLSGDVGQYFYDEGGYSDSSYYDSSGYNDSGTYFDSGFSAWGDSSDGYYYDDNSKPKSPQRKKR